MPSSATPTPQIYTLPLHAALPIYVGHGAEQIGAGLAGSGQGGERRNLDILHHRSEEHTSELQSLRHLVCRLLRRRPPRSTLFPYTPLFRSMSATALNRSAPDSLVPGRVASGGTLIFCTTDRKSTRLNSSHLGISYAVFCDADPPDLHSSPTRRSSDLCRPRR